MFNRKKLSEIIQKHTGINILLGVFKFWPFVRHKHRNNKVDELNKEIV